MAHAVIGGSDAAKIGAAERCVRQAPRWVVQNVEGFPTELHFVALFDAETLVGREIPVEAARADHRIAARIPEVIDGLQGKSGRYRTIGR
jgi:hypothetical protein